MEIVNNSGKQVQIPSGGTVEAVVEKRDDGYYGRLRIREGDRISFDDVEIGPFEDEFDALHEAETMVPDFLDATSAATEETSEPEEVKSLKVKEFDFSRYDELDSLGKYVFDKLKSFGMPPDLLDDVLDLDVDEQDGYCDIYFYSDADVEDVLDCLEECGVEIDGWDTTTDFPDFEGEPVNVVGIDISDFWG